MTIAPTLNAVHPSVDVERRAEPRIEFETTAQLMPYPQARHAHFIDVRVLNYSETGIGLVHDQGLLVGQLYVVREPTITAGHTCLYSVIRSDRQPDGTFHIGLRTVSTMTDNERDPFAPPPAPGISTGTKILFLIFALAGTAVITLVGVLHRSSAQ